MNRALEVVALQHLDDELAGHQMKLASVEERLASDPALEAAREALAAATKEHRAATSEQKRLEAEIAGLDARIEPEEKRLYDGSVRNPKDLQNIQAEIAALKRQKSGFEDELLGVLSTVEAATATLDKAKATAEREEQRHASENETLLHDQQALGSAVATATARVQSQRAKIPPADLTLYDHLRRRKSGVAIAKISGSSCAGCRIAIPDAMRRKALSTTSLAQCPNCERILYLG